MISEAQRVRFYCKLGEVLGVEEASTLVTLWLGPETDFVTRSDLEALEAAFERRIADVNSRAIQRHELLDSRVTRSDSPILRKFDGLERRLDELERRLAEIERGRQ